MIAFYTLLTSLFCDRYKDDILYMRNEQFHSYINSIYPSGTDIKDTTENSTSASILNIVLKQKITTNQQFH
jgi:hypothetical protein